ncbi:MAG: methionyl-tRNA formyltransferase, partial [Candidatus Omnitrophota bacterium]
PWPGAYTYFKGEKINIWKTSTLDGSANQGEVVEAKKELVVGAKKGLIKIEEIQLEGKKRMNSAEFLRGYRKLKKGDTFDVKR